MPSAMNRALLTVRAEQTLAVATAWVVWGFLQEPLGSQTEFDATQGCNWKLHLVMAIGALSPPLLGNFILVAKYKCRF